MSLEPSGISSRHWSGSLALDKPAINVEFWIACVLNCDPGPKVSFDNKNSCKLLNNLLLRVPLDPLTACEAGKLKPRAWRGSCESYSQYRHSAFRHRLVIPHFLLVPSYPASPAKDPGESSSSATQATPHPSPTHTLSHPSIALDFRLQPWHLLQAIRGGAGLVAIATPASPSWGLGTSPAWKRFQRLFPDCTLTMRRPLICSGRPGVRLTWGCIITCGCGILEVLDLVSLHVNVSPKLAGQLWFM